MKKKELQSLVQECLAEVLEERKKKSAGDDEFKRVDKGEKGKVAKDKGEEEVYGAGYAAGEKAAKKKFKKLAEAYKKMKEENIFNTAQMGGILGGRNYSKEAEEDKAALKDIKTAIANGVSVEDAIKQISDKYQLRSDYLQKVYDRNK
jgi:hypothetical protein